MTLRSLVVAVVVGLSALATAAPAYAQLNLGVKAGVPVSTINSSPPDIPMGFRPDFAGGAFLVLDRDRLLTGQFDAM